MSMNHDAKPKDEELERMKAEFLAKAMPSELGISNNTWNNKLTKAEKDSKAGK